MGRWGPGGWRLLPPVGGAGAVTGDMWAGDQLEGQVGERAPAVVEEFAYVGFAAHGLGPGGVVVDDVVGE